MDTRDLELFVTVVRSSGFARAARLRGLDPSQVSRRMAALEKSLECRLFERSTRRFRPTEAGLRFLEQVEPVLDALENATARVRDVDHEPRGRLRITASVAFGHEILVPLTPAFRERFPDLQLDYVLRDNTLDLQESNIDLAIRLGPRPQGNLVRERLFQVRHRVCASPAYISRHGALDSPASLPGRDCVLFPFQGYRERWRFRGADGHTTPVTVAGSVWVSNALALKRCVLDGLGPGLLANWMIAADLAEGRLVDLLPAFEVSATTFDTGAWMLYPQRPYQPAKLRALLEFLRETVGGRTFGLGA